MLHGIQDEEGTDSIVQASFDWHVMAVQVADSRTLEVTFRDGTSGRVQFGPESFEMEGFAPLQDDYLFQQVYLDNYVVTWPGDIDISPETMHEDIKETGVMIVRRQS